MRCVAALSRKWRLSVLAVVVAVRAARAGRGSRRGGRAHRLDRVAEADHQRTAGDEVALLDLLVVVAGALLRVGVGGDPGEGDGELVAERVGRNSPGALESAWLCAASSGWMMAWPRSVSRFIRLGYPFAGKTQ